MRLSGVAHSPLSETAAAMPPTAPTPANAAMPRMPRTRRTRACRSRSQRPSPWALDWMGAASGASQMKQADMLGVEKALAEPASDIPGSVKVALQGLMAPYSGIVMGDLTEICLWAGSASKAAGLGGVPMKFRLDRLIVWLDWRPAG